MRRCRCGRSAGKKTPAPCVRERALCPRTLNSGRPGGGLHPVAMMDNRRAAVRAHAGLGQRERRRAEGAFRGNAANDPVRTPATRAVIHFMFSVHGMVAAAGGIVRHAQIAKCRIRRHKPFLSVGWNGRIRPKLHGNEAAVCLVSFRDGLPCCNCNSPARARNVSRRCLRGRSARRIRRRGAGRRSSGRRRSRGHGPAG